MVEDFETTEAERQYFMDYMHHPYRRHRFVRYSPDNDRWIKKILRDFKRLQSENTRLGEEIMRLKRENEELATPQPWDESGALVIGGHVIGVTATPVPPFDTLMKPQTKTTAA